MRQIAFDALYERVDATKLVTALAPVPLVLTLASRNLIHDRIQMVGTIVGIVFSIVLVSVQLGIYVGSERMITQMIDRAHADLWIVPQGARSFEDTAMLGGPQRFQALATPGVADVTPLVAGFAKWIRPDGGSSLVMIIGVNPGDHGLQPWNMVEGSIGDLATPNGVIVDRSYFPLLGVTGNGQWAQIRSRVSEGRVRVVGLTDLIRSFTTWPYVFTTLERSRGFLGGDLDHNTFYLVQISPRADVEEVHRSLAADLTDAEVITPAEFHDRSLSRWLYGTGAGMALIGGAMLGVLVGTIIVAQALYMSTKEHINEFATLRAIGSSAFYIHQVILWQALLTAVIGFCIAASLAFVITLMSAHTALPIVMTPTLTLILFALTLVMCAISAASSIIKVTRIDPAVVFTR